MRTNNLRAVAGVVLCVILLACASVRADEPPSKAPVEKTYTVNFVRVQWEDVLDWYAKVSGLKADLKVKPVGPLTVRGKDRKFTIAEITDLLNEALAQQKLLLVPHHKSFALLSTEGKIDPKHVPAVELKDLSKFGRSAIVEVAIPIPPELGVDATEAGDELKKLLTPWGEIVYAKGKWVIVRDTVGNIRRIIATLEACATGPYCGDPVRPVAPMPRIKK